MLAALAVPGYSSISQHLSDLEVLDSPLAMISRIAAIVNGISIVLFGIGVLLISPSRFVLTAITAFLGGASMISNGVFITGDPRHGLYAMAIFLVLVPACFAAEFGEDQRISRLCLFAAVLTMLYFWLQFSNFDPNGYKGLTQRIAMLVMFGWYSIAGLALLRSSLVPARAAPLPLAEPSRDMS